MRRTLIVVGLALAVGAPSFAEARTACDQYAHNRKVTGTLIGAGVGGLLGNAVAARGVKTEGTLLGAAAGAVVGNQVSRVKCDRGRTYYRSSRSYRPARAYRQASYKPRAYACRYETRPFYDEYGRLVYAPMRVCD
jgi:uncharacterized protein YcfJ